MYSYVRILCTKNKMNLELQWPSAAIIIPILTMTWLFCQFGSCQSASSQQIPGEYYVPKAEGQGFSLSGALKRMAGMSKISCAAQCQTLTTCIGFSIASEVDDGAFTCTLGSNGGMIEQAANSNILFNTAEVNKKVGMPCVIDTQCLGYPGMTCQQLVCKCSAGFVVSTDGNSCLPGRSYAEPCVESVQCPASQTCSTSGYCPCESGYRLFLNQEPPCIVSNSTTVTDIDMRGSTNYTLMFPNPRANYDTGYASFWCVRTKATKRIVATVTFWDVHPGGFLQMQDGCTTFPYPPPYHLGTFESSAAGILPSLAVSQASPMNKQEVLVVFAPQSASALGTGFTLVLDEV